MITLLILIPIAALLILDYFIADEFRAIAARKGFCGRKYFWWSFFCTFVGYLMVVALPDRNPLWTAETEKTRAAQIPGCRQNDCR